MLLVDVFREEFDHLWRMIENHPFLTGLEDGSLPFQKFAYYIVQDCYFLYGWNRALFVAAARAPDWKSQQVYSRLISDSNEEVEACRKLALAVGATETQINDVGLMSPICASYTDWYLRVAYQGTMEELTSAMLVCLWTYAPSKCGGLNLGERFSKALLKNYHVKNDVVNSEIYGSATYLETIQQFKRLASRNSDKANGEELERRRTNFRTGSDFEYKFWEMAYGHDPEEQRRPTSCY